MALNLNKIIGRFALVLVALAVSGCTGMYLGEIADDEKGTAELTEADVRARADIHSITPETVQQLLSQEQAEADINQARVDVAQLRPDTTEYRYKIAPRDVLLVTVWNHPEL